MSSLETIRTRLLRFDEDIVQFTDEAGASQVQPRLAVSTRPRWRALDAYGSVGALPTVVLQSLAEESWRKGASR